MSCQFLWVRPVQQKANCQRLLTPLSLKPYQELQTTLAGAHIHSFSEEVSTNTSVRAIARIFDNGAAPRRHSITQHPLARLALE